MNNTKSLHPAAWFVALYLAVAVGRLPELFEFLQPIHLGKVTLLLAFVAVILNWQNSNSLTAVKSGRRMILFAALCIVSLSFSIWRSGTLAFITKDLVNIFSVFFLTYKTSVNLTTIRFYFMAFGAILGVMTVMAILAYSTGRMVISDTYDPNDVGLVVLTSSALLYGYSRGKNTKFRTAIISISILGLFVALSTQSRGAFLGIIAVVVYFMISDFQANNGRLYRWPSIQAAGLVACLVVVFLYFLPDSSWDRILTLFELEKDYNTSSETGRLAIWQRGVETFFSRPWGVGAGVYQSADIAVGGRYHTAHNSMLQIAVELGLIGLLIFVGFFLELWRIGGRLICASKTLENMSLESAVSFGAALRGSTIAFLITSFFLSMGYSRIFYTILGLAAAIELVAFGGGRGAKAVIESK